MEIVATLSSRGRRSGIERSARSRKRTGPGKVAVCVCVCARATTVTTSDRVSYREDKSRMSEGMERRKRMNNLETAACQRV